MYFDKVMNEHPDWKAVWCFSVSNPWIDFLVFVPEERIADCREACRKGIDDFWDNGCGCYSDLVEWWLHELNVPYEIIHGELILDESDVTLNWKETVENLDKSGVIVAYA